VEKKMAMRRSAAGEESAMSLYLRELRAMPRLTPDEEQSCARLAAGGDSAARQLMIQANLRFVIMVAKRYLNRGVPLDDLVNEGNIGLIRAAARFDPDRGIRFVSYAVWWIRQAILRALRENGSLIRVPRNGSLDARRVEGMPAAQWTLSLDSPVGDQEEAEPFGASLADPSAARPEEVLIDALLKDDLDSALAGLSGREASILRYRFGLSGRAPTSLQKAGVKHGVSEERARQIEKKAIRKIRASSSARQLACYAS
jgi:RNA polymerase primary sigma factor